MVVCNHELALFYRFFKQIFLIPRMSIVQLVSKAATRRQYSGRGTKKHYMFYEMLDHAFVFIFDAHDKSVREDGRIQGWG